MNGCYKKDQYYYYDTIKDTERNDVEAVHTVLVVVQVHRLVRVQDDVTVAQLAALSCDTE